MSPPSKEYAQIRRYSCSCVSVIGVVLGPTTVEVGKRSTPLQWADEITRPLLKPQTG